MEVIKFNKKQNDEMISMFDESMLGSWHIVVPPTDYTACGHATDEYNIKKKHGKITCKECLKTIKFFKEL